MEIEEVCIADLPSPVLGRVFQNISGKDVLSVLLCCKYWLQIAQQECPAWWEAPHIHGDNPQLALGLEANRAFLRAFQCKAAGFRQVQITALQSGAFSQLLGSLMHTLVERGNLLQSVKLDVSFRDRRHYVKSCEVCSVLTLKFALLKLQFAPIQVCLFKLGLPWQVSGRLCCLADHLRTQQLAF
jgi:hypothetical protein